jgi:HSP20 family protein
VKKESEFFWLGSDELRILYHEIGAEDFTLLRPKLASRKAWEPKIDLIEEETRLVLKVELPGVNSDEIELSLDAATNRILIRGMREENLDSEENVVGVYQLEILYGDFERSVQLPSIPIDSSKLRALHRNGLLIVLIPKAAMQSIQIEKEDV